MEITVTEKQQLEKIKAIIEKQFTTHYSADYLASLALMSRSKLVKLYRIYFGMALFEHLQWCRLSAGKRMLEEGSMSVKLIAAKCGYRHACNFSTAFKKRYGLSPMEYKKL